MIAEVDRVADQEPDRDGDGADREEPGGSVTQPTIGSTLRVIV